MEGSIYIARYPFKATQKGQLSFAKGDLIRIYNQDKKVKTKKTKQKKKRKSILSFAQTQQHYTFQGLVESSQYSRHQRLGTREISYTGHTGTNRRLS